MSISSTGGQKPDFHAIPLIVDKPPQCLLDRANEGKLVTMHVWFGEVPIGCLFPIVLC